jgi:catechol 2,3-dioxygenase-like lactoylglutathione lyase family enzyme
MNGADMKPRITVITIGVDDLEESLRFYRNGQMREIGRE